MNELSPLTRYVIAQVLRSHRKGYRLAVDVLFEDETDEAIERTLQELQTLADEKEEGQG